MKKVFYKILHFGTEPQHSSHDLRRIKTVNLLNLLVIFFLLIGFVNYFILETELKVIPSLVFISLASFSLVLSVYRKTNLSFLLFTLNVNLSIFFVNKCYPLSVGSYVFYYPVIVSIVLLNKPSIKDRYAMLHFSMCVLFFLASLFIDVPEWRLKNLTEHQIKLLLYFNIGIAAVLTGLLSGLMNRLISNQNKEILLQNKNLTLAKKEINLSLKEKEILLAELHHRVKNNLAIISGLLNLQEDSISNEEAKKIISDSKTRIMSMALVHKMLYENNELKSIDLGKYASELIYELFYSFNLLKTVTINEDFVAISIPVNKSIPLGLILNEVVTNCIKYTFKSSQNKQGVFDISLRLKGNSATLVAKDNGSGFPKDFNEDADNQSLGIFLIKTLAEQIDGNVRFSNEQGAKIELNFNLS
ncbi:sensor histidine kinase [Aurantibacillus circumpalustris]|uniref:sensor histidine kinase n=1 Tax=Aurantibacillus circumpalustris TaxID=3036359 RepID=UPI00295ABFF6|nr:sensor histidine kinase [Aurantibacillus circumpalustris]